MTSRRSSRSLLSHRGERSQETKDCFSVSTYRIPALSSDQIRRQQSLEERRGVVPVKLKKGAVMKAKATQSFAQHRGTGATPAAGAKAGAIQGTFTTSDAIPWKPVDPKNHPGLEMFAVWGNPNEGASLILQKFPAGINSGW